MSSMLLRSLALILMIGLAQIDQCHSFLPEAARTRSLSTRHPSNRGGSRLHNADTKTPKRFFLDISVADEDIGRLVFCLPQPDLFPQHTENILQLASGANVGLDPRLTYKNCEFQYSPQFIESFPQYRWAHNLPGRGRNAVGRAEEKLVDIEAMQTSTHRLYGGIYYGLDYSSIPEENAGILTIPMTGPSRGSTGLSVVRVAESPPEWQERLLLNSAVLGWLEPESAATLRGFQQTNGPPVVKACGVL